MVSIATGPIRLIVIDDNPLVVAGIRAHLQRCDDIRLIADAVDGAQGQALIAMERPDVALIDLLLPEIDGLAVAANAKKISPETRNVIITGELMSKRISDPLPDCIDDYFHKADPLNHLMTIIRRIHCGERRSPDPAHDSMDRLESLTLPELAAFMHLVNGASLRKASLQMQTTVKSVDHLTQSLMRKLGIHNRVELLRFAIRERIALKPVELRSPVHYGHEDPEVAFTDPHARAE